MRCPNCHTQTLAELQIGDFKVNVDRCNTCGGIWFDRQELESIMDVAAKSLTVPTGAEKTDRACPRDEAELYAFKYPQTDVTVDMCETCEGLWLDGGELTAIKSARAQLAATGALDPPEPTGITGGFQRLVDWVMDEIDDRELL